MNTPTHIACGACVAVAVARFGRAEHASAPRRIVLAACAVVLGLATHLLLDLLPHRAWIVDLGWFRPMPYHWLVREALFGVAVAIPAILIAGRLWPNAVLGMFAGMYPDIEKVLFLDFHIPEWLVIFKWHSTELSNRTAGLPCAALVTIEVVLIVVFLAAMWAVRRNGRREGA